MTIAYKAAATSDNLNTAFISRSANQAASGIKDFTDLVRLETVALQQETNTSTGTINALSWNKSSIRVASASVINGVASAASAHILAIHNVSGSIITIGNESASASAANRISLSGTGSGYLRNGESLFLIRDVTSSRWRNLNQPARAEVIEVAIGAQDADMEVASAALVTRARFSFTLVGIRASVKVAQTGTYSQFDLDKNGSSVLSTKLTINASEKTSTTAATAVVINSASASFADDDEITLAIDQIGSTIAGQGPVIAMYVVRT